MIQRIQNSKWVFVLISVFLAVIFWMYVRNDLDPPGSRTIYNVPVTLTGETILESQGLTITAVSDTAVDHRPYQYPEQAEQPQSQRDRERVPVYRGGADPPV